MTTFRTGSTELFSLVIVPRIEQCCTVGVCLSVCLSACLPVCLPACLSVCLSVSLSVCLFVSVSRCLSVSLALSLCLSYTGLRATQVHATAPYLRRVVAAVDVCVPGDLRRALHRRTGL